MIAWLINTLIATSILMAVVMIVREPVRRLFGAGVAYALWLLPAARLVMPTLTTTVERAVPAVPIDAAAFMPGALPLAAPSATPVAEPIDLQGLALWLWLAVAAVLLLRGLLVYRRQRRAVLADAVQIARLDNIRIVRTFALRGPMAFGIVDRVIALPGDFDGRYDERQRRLALDHELAHHRSGDIIANHVAFVLLCLQWFNPIAWLGHAAFRFDQEAACDARVLAKADGPDRAAYGQAIAKAASGRALLFSGALDRPSTLQRRLKTMLVNPNRRRRIAGRTLIVAGIAAALPLTASWATRYVDVPVAPTAPLAATAVIADAIAPAPPTLPTRADMETAKADLEVLHRDQETARRDNETARLDTETALRDSETARRDSEAARREVGEALREIDRSAAELRKAGVDPESLKATIRASLSVIEHMDIDKITREAMASVNPDKIKADLEQAEASLARATARLDQLDRQ